MMGIIIALVWLLLVMVCFFAATKASLERGRCLEKIDMCVWARDEDDATAQVILDYLQDSEKKSEKKVKS